MRTPRCLPSRRRTLFSNPLPSVTCTQPVHASTEHTAAIVPHVCDVAFVHKACGRHAQPAFHSLSPALLRVRPLQFNGADLEGAQFENSILTGSLFGKDSTGTWANLKGAGGQQPFAPCMLG